MVKRQDRDLESEVRIPKQLRTFLLRSEILISQDISLFPLFNLILILVSNFFHPLGMKILVILLLCLSLSLADRRSECLDLCSRIRVSCALPECALGYELTNEQCVANTYSCCPTCIRVPGKCNIIIN